MNVFKVSRKAGADQAVAILNNTGTFKAKLLLFLN